MKFKRIIVVFLTVFMLQMVALAEEVTINASVSSVETELSDNSETLFLDSSTEFAELQNDKFPLDEVVYETFLANESAHYYQFTLDENAVVSFESYAPDKLPAEKLRIYFLENNDKINVTNKTRLLFKGTYVFYVERSNCDLSTTMSYELLLLKDKAHDIEIVKYSDSGVDVTTGNYSETFDDVIAVSAGEKFKIQRRYNSNDKSANSFNAGWSINFECKASYANITYEYTDDDSNLNTIQEYNENIIMLTIPDGSVLFFKKVMDYISPTSRLSERFLPLNSCNNLILLEECYLLIMTDGTKYYYDLIDRNYATNNDTDDGGQLYKIVDRHGNPIVIDWNNNKINSITDISGNTYNFTYSNVDGKLQSIRFCEDMYGAEYSYDDNGRLIESVDSSGKKYFYAYNDENYLTSIKNINNHLVSSITYQNFEDLYCVCQYIDNYGATHTYDYDLESNSTTHIITCSDGLSKKMIYGYDTDKNIHTYIQEVGETELKTTIQYYEHMYPCIIGYNPENELDRVYSYHIWNTGKIKKIVDYSGKITEYEFLKYNRQNVDEFRLYSGLPLSKTVLDGFGNILEKEEYAYYSGEILSKKTIWVSNDEKHIIKYSYDDSLAIEKVEEYVSLNCYNNNTPTRVTSYTYDEASEIKGLPTTISSSDSNKVYTLKYDDKGNLIERINPENSDAKDVYEYNSLGLVSQHTSGEGVITLYEYNNDLQETKKTVITDKNLTDITESTDATTEVTFTEYNNLGLPVQIVSPNEYNVGCEATDGTYSNETVGIRYTYNDNGTVASETDNSGNITSYTYDGYGNMISKTMPNGCVYLYTYDELSNLLTESFKETATSEETKLKEYTYSYEDGYTIVTETKYDNDDPTFKMKFTYGHNDSLHQAQLIFTSEESVVNENVKKIHYDQRGNILCELINKNELDWNAVYYTYDNYDANSNTTYNEKFTLIESFSSEPATYEMPEDKCYKYERTDYDINGNIVKTTTSMVAEGSTPTLADENIITVTKEYYADNLLKSETDVYGVTTEYEYDKDRNLSKVTVIESGTENEEKPQIIAYTNSHNGKPKTIKTYVYSDNITDSQSLLTDAIGKHILVTNDYDKNGNLVKQDSSTGLITEYTYNKNDLQTSITSYEKDNKAATSQTEITEYDFAGNVTQQIDKNGNATKFVYNELGYLIYTIHPNGRITLTTRDKYGRVVVKVEAVDYNGAATSSNATIDTYQTDLSNLRTMNRTEYTYYPYYTHDLRIIAKKHTYDPETDTVTSFVKQKDYYDLVGNHTAIVDANGTIFGYEYDVFGNRIHEIHPSDYEQEDKRKTTFEYNMLGKKTKEINYYGDYYSYTYDKKGNILSSAIVEDGESQTISTYTYDDGGRLLTQTDGNGHTTTLVYDDNNRLMKQYAHGGANDETKTDYYSYDVLGNLTEHTTRNGDTIEYEYDVFNRLVKTTSDDGIVTYTYDDNGNILTMTDSTGTTTYTYDSMGRILTKTHSETGTVSYTYDIYENIPYGLVAEITTEPDGDSVTKWYDSEDKIVKVIDGNAITLYNYYNDGRLKSTTKPNGSVSTSTYDDEGNLLTLVTLDAAEDVLDSFTYVYDDNSIGYKNQISKTEIVAGVNKGTTTYEYDIQGRLTKVTNPDGSYNEYTYDNAGNRLTKKTVEGDNTVVTSFTYDSENRLTQSVTGDVTTYYGYDNNGNQISEWTRIANSAANSNIVNLSEANEDTDDLMTLYEYDAFDRLVKIEQGADVIENAYTADGKKLSRTTNGDLTYYVYDGNVVIEEQEEDNEEFARNVYGRNLITREQGYTKAVYGYNGHGDVVYYTNTLGHIIRNYNYDEFGNVLDNVSISARAPTSVIIPDYPEGYAPIYNPYRYAGYEYIEEVKLYDLNARYYNPEIARFLSPDPYYNLGNRVIGLYEINVPNAWSIIQANNLYVYCGNNPILLFDPHGLSPTAKEAAYISGHIYDFDKDSTDEEKIVKNSDGASIGWVLVDSDVGREGMKVGIYIREGEDVNNPSEYVIAFKGTTITNLSDWKNNAEQLLSSKSADMWDAINFGVNFVDSYSNYEVSFVGHSKGGAEAASTAVATNRNAMIFNPATSNLYDYGLDARKYTSSMTTYIVEGDIVNYLEGWFSAPIDKAVYLPQQHGGNWYELWQTNIYQRIQNHLMEAVISALTEEGY